MTSLLTEVRVERKGDIRDIYWFLVPVKFTEYEEIDRVAVGMARCLGWLGFLYAMEKVSRSFGGMERRGGWSRICSVLVSGHLWGQGEALYIFVEDLCK